MKKQEIKQGQLVRIKRFHRVDAMRHGNPSVIGQTGRFIPWRSITHVDVNGLTSPYQFMNTNYYGGEFEFDPDPLDQNKFNPIFIAVEVELVENP